MNLQQIQLGFLQKLKSDYNIEFDIPTVDIEYYLTEGQRRIFERYYELFETDEKARKVLNFLVISNDLDRATYVAADQTGYYPNGEFWTLPVDLAYTLKEEATLNIDACEDISVTAGDWTRVYVRPINLDYYSKNVNNPFKKPYSGMVWRVDASNPTGPQLHMLITGGTYRVQTYHLTYLAYPEPISILNDDNTLFPDIVHQDIIDEAIKVFMEISITNKQLKQ